MSHRIVKLGCACALLSVSMASSGSAQTDYYNTDAGRPLHIEDALPVERYAFELQLAPVRLERERGGAYQWSVEPELAWGLLPRTQLEVGVPLSYLDLAGQHEVGLAGIDVSVLHNLNVETETLPAFALAASVALPVGRFAPRRAYPSVKALLTRTYSFARFHLNGQYTIGGSPDRGSADQSRWEAGISVDRTYPLKAVLVGAELFARQPLPAESSLEWNTAAGLRYQVNPRYAIDAGFGRNITGGSWFFTFGSALAFGIPALMPGR